MKVLKVMFRNGRIVGYRAADLHVEAAQMINMSREEFERDYAHPRGPDAPPIQTLFENHARVAHES